MKTLIAVIASSLLAPALVHAESSSVSAEALTATETSTYVSGGTLLGADHGVVGALSIEGGYRLHGSLWIHGMAAMGDAGGVDEPGTPGPYRAGRIGVEERGCIADAVCAIAGLDVGVRHVDYMAELDHPNLTSAVLVPRLGLDVGGSHLRFRPGIEGILDGSNHNTIAGFDGIDLTGAVAYQW